MQTHRIVTGDGMRQDAHAGLDTGAKKQEEERFQWKNLDFLLKNLDCLLKNLHLIMKFSARRSRGL